MCVTSAGHRLARAEIVGGVERRRLRQHTAEFCLASGWNLGTSLLRLADTILCFPLVECKLLGRRSLRTEGRGRGRKRDGLGSSPVLKLVRVVAVWVSVLQVLLCASNQNSSIVECWSLRKEGLPVNNIFQQISPVGEFPHRMLSK